MTILVLMSVNELLLTLQLHPAIITILKFKLNDMICLSSSLGISFFIFDEYALFSISSALRRCHITSQKAGDTVLDLRIIAQICDALINNHRLIWRAKIRLCDTSYLSVKLPLTDTGFKNVVVLLL